jgi:hypothetical protein
MQVIVPIPMVLTVHMGEQPRIKYLFVKIRAMQTHIAQELQMCRSFMILHQDRGNITKNVRHVHATQGSPTSTINAVRMSAMQAQ